MSNGTTLSPTGIPLRELLGTAAPLHYPPGIELFRQGSPVESVYVIADGITKLSHVGLDGSSTILALRTQGWILGAAAVTADAPHPVMATTLTTCRLHAIPVARFRLYLSRRARLSWYVHAMHGREIHDQLLQAVALRTLPARERLGRLLQKFVPAGAKPREGTRLQLPLRFWEVAQLIAVTPSYLSNLLGDLEREGVIRRSKGWVIILDPHRLSSEDP